MVLIAQISGHHAPTIMIAQNSGHQVQKEHTSEIKQLISSENLGSKFHACGDHS